MAIFGNILWLQYLNFAIVPLVVKMNIRFPPLNAFGLLEGPFPDFSQAWYHEVGAVLCYTMLLNCVTPHIGKVAVPIIKCILRTRDRGWKFGMQDEQGNVRTK